MKHHATHERGSRETPAAKHEHEPVPGRSVQARELPGAGGVVGRAPVQCRGRGGTGSDVHAAAALGVSGSAKTLPHFDRIQQSFGRHDVGNIKAHLDDQATAGARAMSAQAFAMGDHVAFASAPDLHTAAHEAAHVVQQRAGVQLKGGVGEAGDAYERHADAVADLVVQGQSSEVLLDQMAGGGGAPMAGGGGVARGVQRKIVIDGKPHDPSGDIESHWRKYGDHVVEMVTKMHNDGKDPTFTYASHDQFCKDLDLRDYARHYMGEANKDGGTLRYRDSSINEEKGRLDGNYWVKVGNYKFKLKSGAVPSQAIRSIFESKNNVLECNSTMVAVHYRSMLETLGEVAFNLRFKDGKGLIISPHHVKVDDKAHPFHEQGMMETVNVTGEGDLLPGDWVYFKNIDDYLTKHPNGFWTGEHTMYLGTGTYQGFGTAVSTADGIRQKLLDNYNNGLPKTEEKKLAAIPKFPTYARRPVVDKIVT